MEGCMPCRNASENPAGIETSLPWLRHRMFLSRNASENPAGIETCIWNYFQLIIRESQRIRKPSRDWNQRYKRSFHNFHSVATHQKTQQGLKRFGRRLFYRWRWSQRIRKPSRDWNRVTEEFAHKEFTSQRIRKPSRDWNRVGAKFVLDAMLSQRIRKPSRDWNSQGLLDIIEVQRSQRIRKPSRDWNFSFIYTSVCM